MTYYVSTSGRDSHTGTDSNQPLRWVRTAHDRAAAGDVIVVAQGHYEEYFAFTKRVTVQSTGGRASVGSSAFINTPPSIMGITNKFIPYDAHRSFVRGTEALPRPDVVDDGYPNPPGRISNYWVIVQGQVQLSAEYLRHPHPYGSSGSLNLAYISTTNAVLRYVATDGLASNSVDWVVTYYPTNVGPRDPEPPRLVVNAGPDLNGTTSIAIPLEGSVSDNGAWIVPPAVRVIWEKIDGLGTVSIANSVALSTTARFSQPGTYRLRLRATDPSSRLAPGSDTNQVVVTTIPPPCNLASLALNAQPKEISFRRPPGSTATVSTNLTVTVSFTNRLNPPGIGVTWDDTPGVTFDNRNSRTPRISVSNAGEYRLRVCATASCLDGSTATACDTVVVRLVDSPCALEVNAGPDKTLVWDDYGQTLYRSFCTNLEGSVSSTCSHNETWTQISGPPVEWKSSRSVLRPQICFTDAGTHVFRFESRVTGQTRTNDVTIQVNWAPRHFVRVDLISGVNSCCGIGNWVVNTHPTRSLRVWAGVEQCLPSTGRLTNVYVIAPGQRQIQCNRNGHVDIARAEFYPESDLVEIAAASIELPDIATLQAQTNTLDFLLHGMPGRNYWVEATSDFITWEPIAYVMANVEPVWVRDPDRSDKSKRFYRVVDARR